MTQRHTVVARQRRTHPRGLSGIPRRLKIALASRRSRGPVRRGSARGIRRKLQHHSIADTLVNGLPLDLGTRPRVLIQRAGPPVEHALARIIGKVTAGHQHRFEHRRGGSRGALEVQRLSQTNDELDAFSRRKFVRADAAQAFARMDQIIGR